MTAEQNLFSRRTLLKNSIAAGAAATLGQTLGQAGRAIAATAPMQTRVIPATGEKLPVVGIGTNDYSPSTPEERAARKAVLAGMPDEGMSLIDTARVYGQSEEVLGALLAELGTRDKFFLATKTPMNGNFADGKAVLDESFRRLRVSRIDLLQIHSLGGLNELLPLFQEYKQEKKIRYIGVTTSSHDQYPQLLEAMRKHQFDFIQVDYSIDNRVSAEQVLPLAKDKGIAVLNNMPFGGRRGSLFPRLAGKALPDFAAEFDAHSWAQLMLKYNLSHPAITAAIPGTTKPEHLQDNAQGGRGRFPDAALRKRIETFWQGL